MLISFLPEHHFCFEFSSTMKCLRSYNNYILDLTDYIICLVGKIEIESRASVWFWIYSLVQKWWDTYLSALNQQWYFSWTGFFGPNIFAFDLLLFLFLSGLGIPYAKFHAFCTSFVRRSVTFFSFFSVLVRTVTSACANLSSLCSILTVALYLFISFIHPFTFTAP